MLVAGIRMKGNYSDCGKGFATLGKTPRPPHRRQAAVLVLRRRIPRGRRQLRALHADPQNGRSRRHFGPRAAGCTLRHADPPRPVRGTPPFVRPADQVRQSHGYKVSLPTREVYLKGPGMIFRGNPKKYLTEIQSRLRS